MDDGLSECQRIQHAAYCEAWDMFVASGHELSWGYLSAFIKGYIHGCYKGLRRSIIAIGQARFDAPPTRAVVVALYRIKDADRLGALQTRALTATSWDELLAAP